MTRVESRCCLLFKKTIVAEHLFYIYFLKNFEGSETLSSS